MFILETNAEVSLSHGSSTDLSGQLTHTLGHNHHHEHNGEVNIQIGSTNLVYKKVTTFFQTNI